MKIKTFHFMTGGVTLSWLFLLLALLPPPAAALPRVASTSPEVTEVVFELGYGQSLVATSDLSDYPPAAKALPRLGPLFMPSVERALRFDPHWVLLDEAAPVPVFERAAESLRWRTFTYRVHSVPTLFSEAQRLLHEVFGAAESAVVRRAEKSWSHCPHRSTETFLAFVWLEPPILFGPRTFLSTLLEGRGERNGLPTTWEVAYPQVADEWLLRRQPQRVYVLDDLPDAENAVRRAAARWWPGASVKPIVLSRDRFARATLKTVEEVCRAD